MKYCNNITCVSSVSERVSSVSENKFSRNLFSCTVCGSTNGLTNCSSRYLWFTELLLFPFHLQYPSPVCCQEEGAKENSDVYK